jgi:hypothetical protein
MRFIKMILLGLVLSGSVYFLSCKDDDDDPQGCNYVTETQDELTTLNEAAAAYGADPTNPAKCQAYKDAYQAYLDELEDHIDCAALSGQQAELQNSIDQAQAQLALLQC